MVSSYSSYVGSLLLGVRLIPFPQALLSLLVQHVFTYTFLTCFFIIFTPFPSATFDIILDIWNVDDHKVRPSLRRNGQVRKHFPYFSKMHLRGRMSKDGGLC